MSGTAMLVLIALLVFADVRAAHSAATSPHMRHPTAAAAPAAPVRHATLPAASPDGKTVAYCSPATGHGSEVWVVDVASGETHPITTGGGDKHSPGWTNAGTRVTYVKSDDDMLELWSVTPAGGFPRRHANLAAKAIAISPDGGSIAYTIGSWTRNRIWLANADGSDARAITDSTGGYFNLAWSPNDSLIASTRIDTTGALEVWLLRTDGSSARSLVRLPASEGRPQWPAWSPDGRTLALQVGRYSKADPTKSEAYIYLADAATGMVNRLRTHTRPWLDETPSWLDAGHIAFQSTESGRFEVWVMASDGSNARQLTK